MLFFNNHVTEHIIYVLDIYQVMNCCEVINVFLVCNSCSVTDPFILVGLGEKITKCRLQGITHVSDIL